MPDFKYHLCRSKRKTLAIEIKPSGNIFVRAPWQMKLDVIASFLNQKEAWISKQLSKCHEGKTLPALGEDSLAEVDAVLLQRIKHIEEELYRSGYNGPWPTSYRFRTLRRQWGNCRADGVLTFNRYAYFLPPKILRYLYVHEISHLREMNHRRAFWGCVEALEPDFRNLRQELKTYHAPQ